MKKVTSILSGTLTTLLTIILLVTVAAVVTTQVSDGEPSLFGYQIKTVLSGSMEPGIDTGSVILVRAVDEPRTYQVGDVVTFQTYEGPLVTHRIHEVVDGGQSYITKGDNNPLPDTQVLEPSMIVGEYIGITIPYLGHVFSFISSDVGVIMLFIIPGVILVLYSMFTIVQAFREVDRLSKEQQTVSSSQQE
ncbi:hypothetical protein DH09_20640 [Bacillaceae bacterium JMAK1]|nr:hypothetical protein DH09_20640 [Bacillaceae bacterium JMAK1]